MNIQIKINPNDVRRLNSLINEMVKTTGAERNKVIRNTARDLVRAAIKITPKAERGLERWIMIDPNYRRNEDGTPVYLPASKVKAKYRGRNRRLRVRPGLARSGWSGALTRLGVGSNPGKSGLKFSELRERRAAMRILTEISNIIPFIEDIDRGTYKNGTPAHILQRAVRMVSAQMELRLQRMADRIMRKSIGI